MMEASTPFRGGRGGRASAGAGAARRAQPRNKPWVADGGARPRSSGHGVDTERWERGGHRGGGPPTRGRNANMTWRKPVDPGAVVTAGAEEGVGSGTEDGREDETDMEHDDQQGMGEDVLSEQGLPEIDEPVLETAEEREQFYQRLVKEREAERKRAIAEGLMDDPLIPKRLEDAICVVGTCMDMCPRFERYRRERENNLDRLELIPGTKRVDHQRAVKKFERAAGDKSLPSDLRPPPVLKRTLDYLFRVLIPEKGFSASQAFVRDRSRSCRTDCTMQYQTGPIVIDCHDRCARFHILSMHLERDKPGFSVDMEEQQLAYTLQSLMEFYDDQLGKYQSPTEIEMRVYHRLVHIRDQVDRKKKDDIPLWVQEDPVFDLVTKFRYQVQQTSAPITKRSALVVDEEGMRIFGQLAVMLRAQGNVVMIYLVACILERHFGKGTIEDIEAIHGGMSLPEIIDGKTALPQTQELATVVEEAVAQEDDDGLTDVEEEPEFEVEEEMGGDAQSSAASAAVWPAASFPNSNGSLWGPSGTASPFGKVDTPFPAPPPSVPKSAFATLTTTPNVFGTTSVFSGSAFGAPSSTAPKSVFGTVAPATATAFSSSSFGQTSSPSLIFGGGGGSGPFSASAAPAIAPSSAPSGEESKLVNKVTADAPVSEPSKLPSSASVLSSAAPTLNPAAPTFVPNVAKSIFPSTIPASPAQPATPPSFAKSTNPFKATPPPPNPLSISTSESTFSDSPSAFKFVPSADDSPQPPAAKTPWKLTGTVAMPSPLKIDTSDLGTKQNGLLGFPYNKVASPSVATPTIPPLMDRRPPLSLPPTPTIPAAGPIHAAGSLLNFPKLSPTKSIECLSPLVPPSPSTSKIPFPSSTGSESKLALGKSPLGRKWSFTAKGKEREWVSEENKALALAFSRKGYVVKECFSHWHAKAAERTAYADACRRSDAYAEKARLESSKRSAVAVPDAAPPRASKRRARKRISSEYRAPQTDEELARRFKENHDEHERRWAQGSFLEAVRSRLAGKWPQGWQMWLSMNPESDGTAIWLERKFDVPGTGEWASETVFAVPRADPAEASPGLVVFECTPVEGIDDELERKYRILDDCSRLRDAIELLPTERRFMPAVLLIIWGEAATADIPNDLFDMLKKCKNEQIISGHNSFFVTASTKDVDVKFVDTLSTMDLDVKGKLARSFTPEALYTHLLGPYQPFQAEWATRCARGVQFNWPLYSHLLSASIRVFNTAIHRVFRMWGVSSPPTLKSLDVNAIVNSDTAYSTLITWLEQKTLRSCTGSIVANLHTEQGNNKAFPASIFSEHLLSLVFRPASSYLRTRKAAELTIPSRVVDEAVDAIESMLESCAEELSGVPSPAGTPEPDVGMREMNGKRRADEVDGYTETERSVSSSPKDNGTKRQRTAEGISFRGEYPDHSFQSATSNGVNVTTPHSSFYGAPPLSDTASPRSTSSLSIDMERPAVTVAMLRALTQNVRKKYGTGV